MTGITAIKTLIQQIIEKTGGIVTVPHVNKPFRLKKVVIRIKKKLIYHSFIDLTSFIHVNFV
ncbi:MAG: hypothetical protein ACTSP4_10440 [Candidatus Hodarchaeales archaeon]